MLNIKTDFKLPTADMKDERTQGLSVFGPLGESLRNIDSAAFISALLNDGRFCHREPNNTVVWNLQQVNRWLADIHGSCQTFTAYCTSYHCWDMGLKRPFTSGPTVLRAATTVSFTTLSWPSLATTTKDIKWLVCINKLCDSYLMSWLIC